MLLYRVVDNPNDLAVLQQDIDTISDWVSTHEDVSGTSRLGETL